MEYPYEPGHYRHRALPVRVAPPARCAPASTATPRYGAVTPPLVLSSNFSFAGFAEKRQYDYTRSGNPTRDLLGEALAELEGGSGGVVTSTGMAAITLVLNALLQPGEHAGGAARLLRRQLAPVQCARQEEAIPSWSPAT